ncbi:MAG: oxygen-dependent protoporphyrinogen oxidase [Chlamydiales bacterium]|jgi:oxygen-dependent protoporphyrinogen oxidase
MPFDSFSVPSSKHIVIVGAGISGLSLAWYLKKKHGTELKVTVLEKNSRVGGCINSLKKGEFLFESGPRGFRPKGAGQRTLELIKELKIENHLIEADPSAAHRYLWTDKQLQKLPHSIFSLLTSPITRKIIFPLIKETFLKPRAPDSDESIDSFIRRHFGSYLTETLVDPLVSGVFAGDIRKLSLQSCFPLLKKYEKENGSIIKGLLPSARSSSGKIKTDTPKAPLLSFKEGMSLLPESLAAKVSANILLSHPLENLKFHKDHIAIEVQGKTLKASHVFSTIPPRELALLYPDFSPDISALLNNFSYTSLTAVNVGYSKRVLKNQGFGYLIPSKEKEKLLGVTWDSCIFPQQNSYKEQTRLTAMLGGSRNKSLHLLPEEELAQIALEGIHKHLGISDKPESICVYTAHNLIPQFNVGHEDKLLNLSQALKNAFPRLTVLGHHFRGIGVNGCIEEAEEASSTLSQSYT